MSYRGPQRPWPDVDWIALAQVGGFAFAAGTLGIALKALFEALRKGELIPRSLHDKVVKHLEDENAALRVDNRDGARELARLASAFENLAARK